MNSTKLGAGKPILAAASMAILLLWMDGASQSLLYMLAIAVGALIAFIALRNAGTGRVLTPGERLERERQDALNWLAKSDAAEGFQGDESE